MRKVVTVSNGGFFEQCLPHSHGLTPRMNNWRRDSNEGETWAERTNLDSDEWANRPSLSRLDNFDAFSNDTSDHESSEELWSRYTFEEHKQHVEFESRYSNAIELLFWRRKERSYGHDGQGGISAWNESMGREEEDDDDDGEKDLLGSSWKNFELATWGMREGSNSEARRFGSKCNPLLLLLLPRRSFVAHLRCWLID